MSASGPDISKVTSAVPPVTPPVASPGDDGTSPLPAPKPTPEQDDDPKKDKKDSAKDKDEKDKGKKDPKDENDGEDIGSQIAKAIAETGGLFKYALQKIGVTFNKMMNNGTDAMSENPNAKSDVKPVTLGFETSKADTPSLESQQAPDLKQKQDKTPDVAPDASADLKSSQSSPKLKGP